VAAFAPSAQAATAMTTGVVVPIAFVSDIFAVGVAELPSWLDGIGWFFPLRHLVNALGDATNPYLTGAGFSWNHLAVLVAWGVAGGVVASRRLSVEPRQSRAAAGAPRRRRHPAGDARPVNTSRPAWWRLAVREVRHTSAALWRDPSSTFFAVAFPMLLVALVPQIYGAGTRLEDGTPLPQFYAPVMAVYGAAVTAYVNLPEGLARARERGVLRRLRGTPLPVVVRVGAGVVSAAWIGLVTFVLVLALAGVMYGVPIPGTWPGVVVTFVLATLCFAVLGIALVTVLPTSRAVSAVALGTLLPLAFVSDIFVVGANFPAPLDALGWATPLRHAANALADGYAVGATGSGLAWEHLMMIGAWLLLGAIVVVVRADRLVSVAKDA
jgi:ABC-type multidrug transport system permease subunit